MVSNIKSGLKISLLCKAKLKFQSEHSLKLICLVPISDISNFATHQNSNKTFPLYVKYKKVRASSVIVTLEDWELKFTF